jgi:hypothetical protein
MEDLDSRDSLVPKGHRKSEGPLTSVISAVQRRFHPQTPEIVSSGVRDVNATIYLVS